MKISNIQNAVAFHYGISRVQLLSDDKSFKYALPRQVGMYLSRKYTVWSYNVLAGYFKRKNHTTVMYAVEKIKNKLSTNEELIDAIDAIESILMEEE